MCYLSKTNPAPHVLQCQRMRNCLRHPFNRFVAPRCFEPLGVARALDHDRGRGALDLREVVPLQPDSRRAEELLDRWSFVVPGIGTIHGFCPRSHAIEVCAGVAFLLFAIRPSRSTSA
jgi:hypothetical protein